MTIFKICEVNKWGDRFSCVSMFSCAFFSIIWCNCSCMLWPYKLIAWLQKVSSRLFFVSHDNLHEYEMCSAVFALERHTLNRRNRYRKQKSWENEWKQKRCIVCTLIQHTSNEGNKADGVLCVRYCKKNLHRNFLSKSHQFKIKMIFKVISFCFKMKIMMNLDYFVLSHSLSFCCCCNCMNERSENSLRLNE